MQILHKSCTNHASVAMPVVMNVSPKTTTNVDCKLGMHGKHRSVCHLSSAY